MRNESGRIRTVCRGAAAFALAALLAWPSAALAAEDAEISGTLIHGERETPIARTQVVLHTFQEGVETGTERAKTGSEGEFTFSGLDPAAAYAVTTEFEGAEYRTQSIQVDAGKTAEVTLRAYDTTTSPEKVSVTEWLVWVDRQEHGISVQHSLGIDNSGKATYVGDERTPDGQPAVIQLPLAQGASDLQFLGRFMECCGITLPDGSTFAHTAPILPGKTDATLWYAAEETSALSFPVRLPTKSFSLLVPSDVEVASEQLAPGGETEDRGVTYRVLTATDLAPGDTIQVSLTGIDTGKSPRLLVFFAVLVAAFLAVAVLGAWRLIRAGRSPKGSRQERRAKERRRAKAGAARARATSSRERPERAKAPAGGAPAAAARTSAGEPSPNGKEQDSDASLLIEEIAALDLAYERGILEEDTYQRVRSATKERLLRLRNGEAEATPTEARPRRDSR